MVTQKDIAKIAGVNRTTVSAALNDYYESKRIPEDKRAEIKAIARRMGYVVDDIARSIKTGRANVIGYVMQSGLEENGWRVMSGLSACAEKHHYTIKIINGSRLGDSEPDRFKNIVNICVKNRLAALVFSNLLKPADAGWFKKKLAAHNILPGFISNGACAKDCLHVTSNDQHGIAAMVKYLYDLGHRKIAYISQIFEYPASRIRRDAYKKNMKDYQLKIPRDYVFGGYTEEIRGHLDKLFADKKNAPSAIVCSGDPVAGRVSAYLAQKHGIKCPQDVSIAGFADLMQSRNTYPPISTVYEPFKEMGERIVEKLIAKIQGRDFGNPEEVLDTKLVIRESTGPLNKIKDK